MTLMEDLDIAEFVILKNGMSQTVHVDLTNDCIQEISFENIF